MRPLYFCLVGACLAAASCTSDPNFTDGDGTGASGGNSGTGANGGDGSGASSQGGSGAAPTGGTGTGGAGAAPTGGGPAGGAPVGGGGSGGVVAPICGDGIINGTDECDDANPTNDDGCTGCVVDCPAWGWKDPATNHCYFDWDPSDNWNDMLTECEDTAPGTSLAVFSDVSEFDLVMQHVPQDPVWIGGHDQNNEGVYEWINGEPWTFGDGGYPWQIGQPELGNGEDCIFLSRPDAGDPLRVYDRDCSANYPALCERTPIEVNKQ